MRRFRALALMVAVIVVATPAQSEAPVPASSQVLGTVTNAARPVANALVIALNLQDFGAVQAWTRTDGTFSLPSLKAGIYKIIAVKQGFIPTIMTLVPFTSLKADGLADKACLRAVPRSYQVTPGHPRPATNDTAKASQAKQPTA